MSLALLVISFFLLLILGVPVSFGLIASGLVYMGFSGYPITLLTQRMFEGMNSFALLAVPFFVLTGRFMAEGPLLETLIDWVNSLFGHIRGALSIICIATCLFMGSIVGIAVAQIVAIGSFLIPMMKKEGYSAAYAGGVTVAGSVLGPIMPPGVLMIIYCLAVGSTSITGLFLAAVIPALLLCVMLMVVAHFIARKRNYPTYSKSTWSERLKFTKKALPTILLPVIILGGIFGSVFTVTEASAIAALYSFILTTFVYKAIKWSDLPRIFKEAAWNTGIVLLLGGAATVASWAIANEQVVFQVAALLSNVSNWVFLLGLNVFLLINGCFMDDYPSVLIWGPIIAPIAIQMGIDPLHIGLIICFNLVVGLITPPVGISLFVTAPLAGVTMDALVKETIPFYLVCVAFLFIVTYVPQLCLFLPRLVGY